MNENEKVQLLNIIDSEIHHNFVVTTHIGFSTIRLYRRDRLLFSLSIMKNYIIKLYQHISTNFSWNTRICQLSDPELITKIIESIDEVIKDEIVASKEDYNPRNISHRK